MQKLLVPTDFSNAANNALEYAAQLAQKLHAAITLIHIEPIQVTDTLTAAAAIPNDLSLRTDEMRSKLDTACKVVESTYQVACSGVLRVDAVGMDEAIRLELKDNSHDMVVMGTNGMDDFWQFYSGTNTWHVIASTETPVLVVPEECSYRHVSKLVYATGYEDHDKQSLGAIEALMMPFDPDITVLHVSEDENVWSESTFETFRQEVRAMYGPDHHMDFARVVDQDTASGINHYIHANRTDMLAMLLPERGFVENLLHRSLTKKLSAVVDLPLLVLH